MMKWVKWIKMIKLNNFCFRNKIRIRCCFATCSAMTQLMPDKPVRGSLDSACPQWIRSGWYVSWLSPPPPPPPPGLFLGVSWSLESTVSSSGLPPSDADCRAALSLPLSVSWPGTADDRHVQFRSSGVWPRAARRATDRGHL